MKSPAQPILMLYAEFDTGLLVGVEDAARKVPVDGEVETPSTRNESLLTCGVEFSSTSCFFGRFRDE